MKIKKLITNDKEICRFSESIEVNNDDFLFEVLRQGETILLIDNEPKSVVWHDNGPSSVHFYTLKGIPFNKEIQDRLREFAGYTQQETLTDENLLSIFEVYRPLIKSGIYRFFYTPPHSFEVTNHFFNPKQYRGFELLLPESARQPRPSLYLAEGVFMFTQSIETIDNKRVEYFRHQILNGKSAMVVTLGMQPINEHIEDISSLFEDAYPQFIIDGHHKAMAYYSLNREGAKKGLPYQIYVPGIFSIVRVSEKNKEGKLTVNTRKEIMSKLLTDKEINEIIEFYENWK